MDRLAVFYRGLAVVRNLPTGQQMER